MRQFMSVLAISLVFWIPGFAEESDKGQKPVDQNETTTQTPLPPGLEKRGKVPPGLEKKGKTPHGWSQGKAGWKHGSQTPHGSHPMGNGRVLGGGHSGHANPGHGHR